MVMMMVDELGFDPVNNGPISNSWRQQPGTPCYTRLLDQQAMIGALGLAQFEMMPQYRKAAAEKLKAFLQAQQGNECNKGEEPFLAAVPQPLQQQQQPTATAKRIGIIGAGCIGSTLGKHWVEKGYDVYIANSRGVDGVAPIAAKIGAKPVTVVDAAKNADVIVVTIPMKCIPDLPKNLFNDVPHNAIIIDTNNYYPDPRDGPIAAIDNGMIESEWVQQQLGRPVVKAFNTLYFTDLDTKGRPKGSPDRLAMPVSADESLAQEW